MKNQRKLSTKVNNRQADKIDSNLDDRELICEHGDVEMRRILFVAMAYVNFNGELTISLNLEIALKREQLPQLIENPEIQIQF